jgi:hypothetical protein
VLLRRSLAISAALLVLVASCVPLACSSSDSPPPPPTAPANGTPAPGDVIVGIVIDNPTTVTSLVAAPLDYEAVPVRDAKLHWELRGASGVVASGDVNDPRPYESELPDDKRLLHHYDLTTTGGPLEIRMPNAGGEIVITDPGGVEVGRANVPTLTTGETSLLLATDDESGLAPATGLLPRAVTPEGGAGAGGPEKIIDHGDCPGNLNVLIMPEGFTAAQMEDFHAKALSIASELGSISGWNTQYDRINVWRQDVASRQSGLSDPGCRGSDEERCPGGPHRRVARNTAWNVSYGAQVRRGAWWTTAPKPATWALYQRAKATSKATILFVLVNSTDSIGAAIPSQGIIVQSASSDAGVTLAHEMGHAALDLADEYDYGTCRLASAGKSANVTKAPAKPPWAALVTTPPVEGGDYCAKGVWRPQEDCLMRSLDKEFCPVCANKLSTVFDARMARHAKVASCQRPPPDCTTQENTCDKTFPGRNLVCSANGGGKSCCRQPFPVTNVCFSDDDCTGTPGQICALATNDPDGGASFTCITPSSQPCVPVPGAAAGPADAGAP